MTILASSIDGVLPPIEILVAEDEPASLTGLTQLISSWGASKVWAAPSGNAALRLLKQHRGVQVIVTDVVMSDGDGLYLAQEAKRIRPNVQVVVLTAKADLNTVVEFLRTASAVDYLTKPVELSKLRSTLVNCARLFADNTAAASAAGRIFLSYAREDEERVARLYRTLKRAGFEPWMDRYDLVAGQTWNAAIRRAIRDSRFFLACLSERSVNKRGTVQEELRAAIEVAQTVPPSQTYLIPVRLNDCDVPDALAEFHWVDLFEPDGWERLRRAIHQALATRSGKAKRGRRARTSREPE